MSRKSKRNRPPGPVDNANVSTRGAGLGSRKAVGLGLIVVALVVAGLVYFQREQTSAPSTRATSALASEHSPTLGEATAKVHIVEFLDPACETCAAFFPIVKQLMAEHPGRIRLSTRHVALHEGSEMPIRVLEASRAQDKYWETLQTLFATQPRWAVNHTVHPEFVMQAIVGLGLDMNRLQADMYSPEVSQRVARDLDDAKAMRVTATPEYFVNGQPMPSFGEQQLRRLVTDALSEAY